MFLAQAIPDTAQLSKMERIINEIRSVKRFVAARSSHASCDLSQLEKSFADQLLKLIGKSSLVPSDVAVLMEVRCTDNPYGELSTQIIEALDKHTFAAEGEVALEAESSTKQMLQQWWSYLDADEWAIMDDPQKIYTPK